MKGFSPTTPSTNANDATNGDAHDSSSEADSEVDFDPSAPETLQERASFLTTRVRQLKRELRESRAEIASLRGVVRENAAKEMREKVDVGIQCHVIAPEGHGWMEVTERENGEGAGLSISESIREAAQKVQRSQLMEELEQRGFVYEATSGFYYDPSSGYYYDAERQLYYDGNTKTYYSYNQDSGTYTAFTAEEEEEERKAEEGRGGKRRRQGGETDRERDPEMEERLKKEKEKLLGGIFNLRKCREVEKKKKEEEEVRRKKRKRRTEEEKRATKSKWDDDSCGSESEEEEGKRKKKKKSAKKEKSTSVTKSEAEDGEISESSFSSSSSSSSEDDEKRKKKRRKKKSKRSRKSSDGKKSKDKKKSRRKDRSRDRSRDRNRGRDRDRNRSRDRNVWVEKKDSSKDKRRRRSTSSSYTDEDEWRRGRSQQKEYKADFVDKRLYAVNDDLDDHLPPCIRIIVVGSDSIDIGSLFIVTKDGAVIGSARDAAVRVEEEGISSKQASVTYDMRERHYVITQTSDVTRDTLVNDESLSSTATGATSITLAGYVRALNHDDVVGVGSTRLLCHVHDGMDTCDECEPGQVRAKMEALNKEKESESTMPSHTSKQDRMRSEMKNLKRKFGLEKAAFEGPPPVPGEDNYEDRAEQRRKKKGSSHPSHKKTTAQGTSVKKALATTNKGHQLLSKLGWSEGKGLGKSDQGIVEPIQVGVRSSNAGLGSDTSVTKSMDEPEVSQKEMARIKAQQRFAKILAQEDETT